MRVSRRSAAQYVQPVNGVPGFNRKGLVMEFGLREALFLIGVVVIAAILLDGLRKKYAGKKTSRQSSASSEKVDADFDLFAGDISTPRVVKKNQEPMSSADVADAARDTLHNDDLADISYETGSEGIVGKPRKVSYREAVQQRAVEHETETVTAGDDDLSDFNFGSAETGSARRSTRDDTEAESLDVDTQGRDTRSVDFDDVIVINVMAKPKDEISGNDLLRALLSVGLRFGDMNIFHRHEQLTGKGPVLFSAVNVVEPGTFDLNHMEDFKTPGICMFLRLPGPKRSLHAFEQLVESARKIANMLGAELKDENHSVLTQQTIEHYRQRVLDFERKMLSHRAR